MGGLAARLMPFRAAVIGHVEAKDAESAIKEAIRVFGITDPEKQKPLAARRVR